MPIQPATGTSKGSHTDNVNYGITTDELPYLILKTVTAIKIEEDTDTHIMKMTLLENIDGVVSDACIGMPDFGDISCSNSSSESEQDKCFDIEPEVYQRVRCGGISLEEMTMTADGNSVV